MIAKGHRPYRRPLTVHGRHPAPLLRTGVEHLHRVQPFLTVIPADGVEAVLHNGHAHPGSQHGHCLRVPPSPNDGVVDLHRAEGVPGLGLPAHGVNNAYKVLAASWFGLERSEKKSES